MTNVFTLQPLPKFSVEYLRKLYPYDTPDKVVADYTRYAKVGDTAFVSLIVTMNRSFFI